MLTSIALAYTCSRKGKGSLLVGVGLPPAGSMYVVVDNAPYLHVPPYSIETSIGIATLILRDG